MHRELSGQRREHPLYQRLHQREGSTGTSAAGQTERDSDGYQFGGDGWHRMRSPPDSAPAYGASTHFHRLRGFGADVSRLGGWREQLFVETPFAEKITG